LCALADGTGAETDDVGETDGTGGNGSAAEEVGDAEGTGGKA